MRIYTKIFLTFLFLMFMQLTAIADSNYIAVRQKGLDAYKQKQYKQAIEYLTSIPKSEHTLEIVLCIANSYESIGDTRSAVMLLESLNRQNPNNYSAFYNLGNIYLKGKVYKNAIDSYLTTRRLNSRFAPANYNLGIAYFETKDYHKALFYFQKAIRLNPSNKDYYYNAAVCMELTGDKKSAEDYFKRAK